MILLDGPMGRELEPTFGITPMGAGADVTLLASGTLGMLTKWTEAQAARRGSASQFGLRFVYGRKMRFG